MSCPLSIEDSFGPWAGTCRSGFDFTLLFEESILSLPVSCLFVLVLPIRMFQLALQDVKVVSSHLLLYKTCAAVCLAGVNLALLVLWATEPSPISHSRASIPAAALSFITSIGFCFLSFTEHSRNIRPSFLLTTYLFFSTLLDAARARTLWMLGSDRVIPSLFLCTILLRCVMLLLESTEKRSILLPPYQELSKETTSGSISRSVFFWLNSLFINGYRKLLTLDDLYPLDPALHSQPLQERFIAAWDRVPDKTRPRALMYTWMSVQFWPLATAAALKLCVIGFVWAQTFLLPRAIELASSPGTERYNNVGYGLIGAYTLVYCGIAISTGQYDWHVRRLAIMMRGCLVPTIYRKTLLIESSDAAQSSALTLATTDIETITSGILLMQEIWSSALELGLGVWLLQRQVGAASSVPVGFSALLMVCTIFLAKSTGSSKVAWIKASQERVAATSKTLGNIKWLRLSGLSKVAFSSLEALRARELQISKKFRYYFGGSFVLSACAEALNPVLTFAAFAGIAMANDDTLGITKAFSSIFILNLLQRPLTTFLRTLPNIAGAVGSFGRIQEYLNTKERKDVRVLGQVTWEESRRCNDHLVASVVGTVQWPDAPEPLLDISEWKIQRNTLTLLLGPVGCGKSTLLKALLGETSTFQGEIYTSFSGIAFCEQTPWIPNEVVRKVIVGDSEFDEAWYNKVIEACDLEQDILQWPDGAESIVGSKGISLSGGQKQRLAIARAVYSKREFIVFDDVFSGLDAATAYKVFHHLLGRNGLLRNANMTVVATASDGRGASCADQIIILGKNGRIVQQGSFEEVYRETSRSSNNQDVILSTKEADSEVRSEQSHPGSIQPQPAKRIRQAEKQAELSRQTGDASVYAFYLKSAGTASFVFFAVSMAVYAFFASFPHLWLKWWAEANARAPNADLGKWLGGYTGFGFGELASLFAGVWQLFIVVITQSGIHFHTLLIGAVSRAPMSFFSEVDSGITINRFSQDLAFISMEFSGAVIGTARMFAVAVAQSIMLAISSKYLATTFPLIATAFYFLQHCYLRTSRQMRLLDIEHKAPLYTQLMETLSGLPTIRAFNWETTAKERNLRTLDDSQRPAYLLYCLQIWLIFVVDMIIAVLALILITITTTLREEIGPGYMGVALTNIMLFSSTMKILMSCWVQLETSIGAVARVKSFVAEVKSEEDGSEPLVSSDDIWPEQGAIEFLNVSASYPSTGPILTGITMTIAPGEKVGICGRTGSGKSSLALSLFRMLDIDGGSIFIDRVDILKLSPEILRSRLVAVPQEACILNGTVRHNMDPSNSLSDDTIIDALERVKLWPMIERRGGLDAVIDDGFLSQGQSQLLICARAMVRKSKILVLDEATSSLDEEAGRIIMDLVNTYFSGWTVVAIAHKLDTIRGFDKVAVLDNGRLVEFDNPESLLGRQSLFKELHSHA